MYLFFVVDSDCGTAGHTIGGGNAGGTVLFRVLFPPVVTEAAEGLRHAVHRLAEGDGDGVVLAPVLVLPRGDEQHATLGTMREALLGGVVALGEPVVGDEHHGDPLGDGLVDNGLLAFGDAGGNEDGTLCRLGEAAVLLLVETSDVLAVADDGQQLLCEKGAVAVAVAGDGGMLHPSGKTAGHTNGRLGAGGGKQQAALYERKVIGAERAFALQVAAKG